MAINFFKSAGKRNVLRSLGLQATSQFSKRFPHLSSVIGYKLLMQTHAPKHTKFKTVSPDQHFSLDSRAGKFAVNVFGCGSNVALVSHGWGDTSASFEQLIVSLVDQGYKVVAVDHVGHGEAEGKRSHLPSFIESLEITIAHFEKQGDEVATLIGHSMGGLAVLNLSELTLQHSKVVLISVPVNFFTIMFEAVERFGISHRLLLSVLDRVTPKYGKTWLELQTKNHLHKLHDQTVFIHDFNDRLAPFQDTKDLVSKVNATLIKTQGLGHRRIVSDTGVIEMIRAKLAVV